MSQPHDQDLSNFSMLDLFRQEVESQAALLTNNLLALEQDPTSRERLAVLMRAAHSIKGAARIVGLDAAVKVAHALEDVFVAAQKAQIVIQPDAADILLKGVDLLQQIAQAAEPPDGAGNPAAPADLEALLSQLAAIRSGAAPPAAAPPQPPPAKPPEAAAPAPPPPAAAAPIPASAVPIPTPAAPVPAAAAPPQVAAPAPARTASADTEAGRAVRLSSERLSHMLGMMGELMVQTHWFEPFAGQLLLLKRRQNDQLRLLEELRCAPNGCQAQLFSELRRKLEEGTQFTAARLEEFDFFTRQVTDLTARLYREGLASRMRPFADGVQGFPRMVRDLARQLGKQVRFEILGQNIGVDREVLDKLEAPLTHLLRNALDHGLETPPERQAAGKRPEGSLTLEARHQSGLLHVTVTDDGRGVNLDKIRDKIVARGLTNAGTAARLTEAEVLDFLFLPGFSTREAVTEISGRGVGLDIVRNLAQEVGGSVRVENRPGAGTRFLLQLPITLSVIRALVVEIAGEPYALPLARIQHLVTTPPEAIRTLEGRRYLTVNDRNIGLVDARALLELPGTPQRPAEWPVVVLGDLLNTYGLVVDRLLTESKLVVRPLDPRLGKVRNIAAASLLDDGTPVLILDTEDLVRSIEVHLAGGRLKHFQANPQAQARAPRKHVLVVDDSITVREMERKLLEFHGYAVDSAVDGMEAWNNVRAGQYDLVVSDVDMPRMDGIELVQHLRQDSRLKEIPVVIVSYKDREEDRLRGLEAGANYYLTKSSFHDDSFLKAVTDLIGEP